MPIIVNLDVMMAKRKISLGDLASKVEKRMAFAFPVFSMERLAGN